MAYVKLDCGILHSTLWVNRDEREIFITALLMALPREFTTPQPQLKVGTIEVTGFEAPPGWYGMVEAAGPGIVRQALVEHSAGMQALERLGSPDAESRSKEFEGRRMIRISGGYLILNFMAYRERDHGNAERCRRYRERKAQRMSPTMSDTVSTVTPLPVNMHAYADANALNPKSASARDLSGARCAVPTVSTPVTLPGGKALLPQDLRRLKPDVAPGQPRFRTSPNTEPESAPIVGNGEHTRP